MTSTTARLRGRLLANGDISLDPASLPRARRLRWRVCGPRRSSGRRARLDAGFHRGEIPRDVAIGEDVLGQPLEQADIVPDLGGEQVLAIVLDQQLLVQVGPEQESL